MIWLCHQICCQSTFLPHSSYSWVSEPSSSVLVYKNANALLCHAMLTASRSQFPKLRTQKHKKRILLPYHISRFFRVSILITYHLSRTFASMSTMSLHTSSAPMPLEVDRDSLFWDSFLSLSALELPKPTHVRKHTRAKTCGNTSVKGVKYDPHSFLPSHTSHVAPHP